MVQCLSLICHVPLHTINASPAIRDGAPKAGLGEFCFINSAGHIELCLHWDLVNLISDVFVSVVVVVEGCERGGVISSSLIICFLSFLLLLLLLHPLLLLLAAWCFPLVCNSDTITLEKICPSYFQ